MHTLSGGQCFPLYSYERVNPDDADDLFGDEEASDGYIRRDGITDDALARFRNHYDDASIDKEAIFFYVYGVLHSPEYLKRYRNDLKRSLPRIPFSPHFRAFSDAGRQLAGLHRSYESAVPYELEEETNRLVVENRC